MAWNGSVGKSAAPLPERRPAKSPSKLRGIIAGAAVVLIGIIVLYFVTRDEEPTRVEKPVIKKEVKQPAKTNFVAQTEKRTGMVKVRGEWYPEYDKKGGKIWVTRDKIRYHTPTVYTNKVNRTKLSPESKLFDNQAEREMAGLICAPLGAMVLEDWTYGDYFKKQFLASIANPIIITDEDDEWARAVKRAVIDAKMELKARYDEGEDVCAIMADTRKKLHDLGVYKMEIEQLVRESLRSAKGDAEARKDVYEAANRMLAERGIAPLKIPAVITFKIDQQKAMKEKNNER